MKVALLSTITRTSLPNTIPPLGIMYLAPCLREHGHSIRILDTAKTWESIPSTITAIKSAGIPEGGVFFTTPNPGSHMLQWCREQGRINDVEAYLFMISDRDASVLSYNFTPFPDLIMKMMYIMVQNSFLANQRSLGTPYNTGIKDRILKRWVVPLMYNAYFITRQGLYWLIPRYKKEMIPFELNSRGIVLLADDLR